MRNNKSYTFQVVVKEIDIDELLHTNNLTYLKCMIKAAEKHWKLLSTEIFDERYVWVVLRHEISYFRATSLHDRINIKTWIGNSYGVKSERFVEVYHNGTLCAECLTIWCLMDKKTMKPTRINSDILEILED